MPAMTYRTDRHFTGQPAPAIARGAGGHGMLHARAWPRTARAFLTHCLLVCCLTTFWQTATAAATDSPITPETSPATATAPLMDAPVVDPASLSGEHGNSPAASAPGVAAQAPSPAGVDELGKPAWRQLEPGLDFGEFQLTDSEALLTALRIDPARFDFVLCARSQDGGGLRSLNQWAEQYGLAAAINASMYLPDGITSTGYMRQNDHYNNKRVVQRFGAFFVAGPDSHDLPGAAIVDRDDPQWEKLIGQYRLVIQNYRMTSADRRILWSPGGPHYSISAVAQDGEGRILFLHCRQPVEAYAFAQQLLHLPLNVRTVMYVEGGGQAGLLVRSAGWKHELAGLSTAGLLVTGDLRAQLPNVLGAVRKADDRGEPADSPASAAQSAAQPSATSPAGAPTETPKDMSSGAPDDTPAHSPANTPVAPDPSAAP